VNAHNPNPRRLIACTIATLGGALKLTRNQRRQIFDKIAGPHVRENEGALRAASSKEGGAA